MLAYPFPVVLHSTFQQKIDIPVYVGHEPLRRLGCHNEPLTYPQFKRCVPWDKTTLFEN